MNPGCEDRRRAESMFSGAFGNTSMHMRGCRTTVRVASSNSQHVVPCTKQHNAPSGQRRYSLKDDDAVPCVKVTAGQWSFRKTGTMGTLGSQAEICVWVQASGRFCGGPGYHLQKCLRLYMKNPAI